MKDTNRSLVISLLLAEISAIEYYGTFESVKEKPEVKGLPWYDNDFFDSNHD